MTKNLKSGGTEDKVGSPILSTQELMEQTGESSNLVDAVRPIVEALGFKVVDVMSLGEEIQRIKRKSISDVITECVADMAKMGRGDFFQKEGIDLTNVEGRLKRKYVGHRYEKMVYSLKVWLIHLVFYVETNEQNELPDAINQVRAILADDN
jgi:hypothetical protein